jgi:cytochrome c553
MRALLSTVAAVVLLVGSWLAGRSRNGGIPGAGALAPGGGPLGRFVAKHPWWTAAVVAALLTIVAAFTVVSGLVPIKASSGHWPITAWFLDFAKIRSVSTHSFGIDPPMLDDEALLLRGAAHYENGCSPCHGRPGTGIPPVMAAMTPPPPELTERQISRWKPGELFSIVKHGIKLTGMPAWPAQQRDDEVWAVVAFLLTLPHLDATQYHELAYGAATDAPDAAPALPIAGSQPPPRAVRDVCWRCHGVDGNGRGEGAANLNDEAMREVAQYYERLPQRAPDPPDDASAIERGDAIAVRGVPDREIPACAECHGPSERPKNPAYPVLAGQPARYLTSQLQLLQQRRRGGSPYVNLMHVFVDRLDEEQIRAVTWYYSSLRSSPAALAGDGRAAP